MDGCVTRWGTISQSADTSDTVKRHLLQVMLATSDNSCKRLIGAVATVHVFVLTDSLIRYNSAAFQYILHFCRTFCIFCWWYVISGCEACNCSEVGSISQQCNETGHCQCRDFTRGIHCDFCTHNYWGLPHQPCQSTCSLCSSDNLHPSNRNHWNINIKQVLS